MKMEGSVALVTGANRGIGRALVERLLEQGSTRVYAAVRNKGELSRVVALDPERVVPLTLDVTDQSAVQAVARQAGDVTLLVNNAGSLALGSILSAPPELIVRDMDTNYYGTLHMVRAFAPVIEANGGGAVVNLLTVVALASMPGLGVYNASKAAAWSMTQSIRADLAGRGIEVFGVFPGAVDTDMIRDFDMPKTSPEEVARAVLDGIEVGEEDIFPDPMSRSVYAGWRADHKAVERQMANS
ncbi:short-chain dehydrogenase (plasmid) [Deinococcus aetherius]|uniref:Short-chain dehydrogenase n=1 Tax=Deinococcus aetherius TaxID=200252 RepID=A0ABN6RNE1_9DEIO|nr:SDR family oxidoreductase [Deinococcus aetherius]BDP43851.1 short-chain dehydrogenase [Deinococcus aetherius]